MEFNENNFGIGMEFDDIVPTPIQPKTAAEYALEELRRDRDRLLAETDWIVIKSAEAGVPVPKAWADYRQALRDLPDSFDEVPLHPKYEKLDWSQVELPVKPE